MTRNEIQAAQEPDKDPTRLKHYAEELQNSLPSMTPIPNTPNEVDKLEAKILEDLKHTLKLMPSNNRETFAFEVARYITKQQALYHAAGLRELLKKQSDIWDDEEECWYSVIPVGDIKEAIAREERE